MQLMSELFKEHNGIHYLGIYGVHGSGKSKQCQAMCNYYSEEYPGNFCIVHLEDDKVNDIGAKEKREKRLKLAIKKIVGSNQTMSYSNLEEAQVTHTSPLETHCCLCTWTWHVVDLKLRISCGNFSLVEPQPC